MLGILLPADAELSFSPNNVGYPDRPLVGPGEMG
jgi:hypothetical protein